MEEDASHAEPSISGSTHTIPQQEQQQPDNTDILIPSFSPPSAPSSPTPTGTLSRLGFKNPLSSQSGAAPGSPVDRGQVSAITVVALLDKLVNMLEAVQDNQQRMEQRQGELESAVRVVQSDVTRLYKNHVSTSNSVNKLVERSRKSGGYLKEVRERLDRQAVQVRKLEANHSHLLKRNHFKVLIFQEDNEIPSTLLVKDSLKTPQQSLYDAESTHPTPSVTGSVEALCTHEGLQTVSLSSDEDNDLVEKPEEEDQLAVEGAMGSETSPQFERRADKFKRSSLRKVDSIKKAFSRQSIEKKMNQFTTKIVPPEKREKIRKSFTPNHPKSPTAKSSSFKVSPMTFNVKKVRDGEVSPQDLSSPGEEAHVEIPPIGSLDGKIPLAEVHTHEGARKKVLELQSPGSTVEVQSPVSSLEVQSPDSTSEVQNPDSTLKVQSSDPTSDSLKVELSINGETSSTECKINGESPAGLAVPEHDEDIGEDEEEEGEDEEEQQEQKNKSPVDTAAEAQIPTPTAAVN